MAAENPRRVFERFTVPARQVVVLAQEEARALEHNYIGTEHILLGLLAEKPGVAAGVLGSLGVTLEQVRARVVETVGYGDDPAEQMIPFTTGAKRVLELSLRETQEFGQRKIETEHILLGLLRENEGVACQILRTNFGLHTERVRKDVVRRIRGIDSNQASSKRAGHPNRLMIQFEVSTTSPAAELARLHDAASQAIKRVYENAGVDVHYIGLRHDDAPPP